jgi:hypothetical protein
MLPVWSRCASLSPRRRWTCCSTAKQEYRAARDAGIPVLAFFLDPATPWPPDHVEWEAKERLAAFKALVESEVTKKVFHTPAELATQVVQSFALLMSRPATRAPARRFRGRAVPEVSLPIRLLSEPDVLVPIGTAEDGLPLLLDVRRSHNLSGLFTQLATAVGATSRTAPQALLDSFRQSLEEFGNEAWAADRIMPVRCGGRQQRVYVGSFTLTGPFTSILASIFETPAVGRRVAQPRLFRGAAGTVTQGTTAVDQPTGLLSSGGSNRFLAELVDHPRDWLGRFAVQMRIEVQAQAAMRAVGAVARELATAACPSA